MKYRRFGTMNWQSSAVGFSARRLAGLGNPESVRLVRGAIDSGINCIAIGEEPERVFRRLGEALGGGYRERVRLALRIPACSPVRDLSSHLQTRLDWLGTNNVDFGLLGTLNRDNWPALRDGGVLDQLEAARRSGRIRHAGFAFHDHYQVLRDILQSYDAWAACAVEFSYMDCAHDPGIGGIQYAASRGLGIVAAEPLRRGRLIRAPGPIARIWDEASTGRSPAEWALRFVWNCPEVATVLLDFESLEEMAPVLSACDAAGPGDLSVLDEILIHRIRDAYKGRSPLSCASCRACMPCPEGIDVPRIFEIYNDAFIYDDVETSRAIYREEGHRADGCQSCGRCSERCARRLEVSDLLRRARELLSP